MGLSQQEQDLQKRAYKGDRNARALIAGPQGGKTAKQREAVEEERKRQRMQAQAAQRQAYFEQMQLRVRQVEALEAIATAEKAKTKRPPTNDSGTQFPDGSELDG